MNFWEPELSVQELLSFIGGEGCLDCGLVLSLFIMVHITAAVCPPAGYIHTGIAPLLTVESGSKCNFWKPEHSVQELLSFTGGEGCQDCQAGFMFIHDGAYNHNCLTSSWVQRLRGYINAYHRLEDC